MAKRSLKGAPGRLRPGCPFAAGERKAKRMKIAVFYEHLMEAARQSQKDLDEILDIARGCGVQGVDFPLQGLDESPQDAKARLDRAGLSVLSLHKDCDFVHVPDWGQARELVDLAAQWGVGPVLVVPGFVEENADAQQWKQAEETIVKALVPLCGYAAAKGVNVTLEDYDGVKAPFGTMEQLLGFTRQVPGLGISFDTGNFLFWAQDELAAFELLKDKIVHIHCKDRALQPSNGACQVSVDNTKLYPSPVGGGVIHMREILTRLSRMGYTGALTIEHFGAQDQLALLRQSAGWLREALDSLEKN